MNIPIQQYIDLGNALTGQLLGTTYSHYRPATNIANAALSSGNLLGTLEAWFDQKNAQRPNTKSDEWTGYFDGSQTQPGDYLSNGARTWFIASQQPLLPYIAIFCERVISIYRISQSSTVGVQGYSGDAGQGETPLITSWPASITQGSRGERGDVTLPQDVRSPFWVIRLPITPSIIIQATDIVTDDLGRRYSTSSAELSEYGWRLSVKQDEA